MFGCVDYSNWLSWHRIIQPMQKVISERRESSWGRIHNLGIAHMLLSIQNYSSCPHLFPGVLSFTLKIRFGQRGFKLMLKLKIFHSIISSLWSFVCTLMETGFPLLLRTAFINLLDRNHTSSCSLVYALHCKLLSSKS